MKNLKKANNYSGLRCIYLFLIIVMIISAFPAYGLALECSDGNCTAYEPVMTAASRTSGYTIKTIDGGSVSTAAEGRPKVLFFYQTTCSNCSYMLRDLQNNGGVSGVDIIVSDMDNVSLSKVKSYISPYNMDYVKWCYGSEAKSAAWSYARAAGTGSYIQTPLVIYLDKNNEIIEATTGYVSNFTSEIKSILCSDGSCGISQPAETAVTAPAPSNIKVCLNGKQLDFDVEPMIINSRTMLPMRKVFEELGMTVSWSDVSRIATATNGHAVIMMEPGCDYMLVNGNSYDLDSPAVIANGRTLVPVRAIAEAMWCQVDWSDADRTVYIESGEYEPDDTATSSILARSDEEILADVNRLLNWQNGEIFGLRLGAVFEQDWTNARNRDEDGKIWIPVINTSSMLDVQKEWNKWFSYFIPVPDSLLGYYKVMDGRLYSCNEGIGDDLLQGKIEVTDVVYRSGDTIILSGINWRYEDPYSDDCYPNYFTYEMKAKADGWYVTSIIGESGTPWMFS